MPTCPTCGQIIKSASDAAELLELLTAYPDRNVYRAANGSGWYVTRGGGRWSEEAVMHLVNSGQTRSVYSDCPNECYHVGRTLDVARTLAERKKHRRAKDAPHIYVDDPHT